MLERLISEDVGATLGYTQTDKTITVQQASRLPTPLLDGALQRNPALCAGLAKIVSANPCYPAADCHRAFSAAGRPAYGRETALLGDLTVETAASTRWPRHSGQLLSHPRKPGQAGPLRCPVEDRLSKAPGPLPCPMTGFTPK